jgi:adenylate cyclase
LKSMIHSPSMKNLIPWIVGLSIMVVVLLGYWINPPALHRLEMLFQDTHFQIRGPLQAGPEVVIAAIDEKSIDEVGRWPWPRNVMARLVDKLVEHQAKVIAFDMVFSSPDESSGKQNLIDIREQLKSKLADKPLVNSVLNPLIENADNDAQFSASLKQSRRVVLGYYFYYDPAGMGHLTEQDLQGYLNNIRPNQFNGFIKSSSEIDLSTMKIKEGYAVESSIPVLSNNVQSAGYVNYDPETDGTLRKIPLIVKYRDNKANKDYFFPPMSMRILEQYLSGSLIVRVGELGPEKVILDAEDPVDIPVNENGELLVNFLGKKGVFPYVSVTDILHDRNQAIPKGSLKDKIVLVGATATALGDIKVTPLDPLFPGVEIQATVIDNVLHNNFLSKPNWILTFELTYLIFFGVLLTLVYIRMKPVMGVMTFVLVAGVQFGFSQWAFTQKGIWITDVFPFLENIFIFSSLTIYGYLTERKERHFIENTFGKYMSPKVIDKLLKDPAGLKLGGEEKELTAFFTDLGGFTTCSELLPAEELVNLLNEYLTEMTEILLRHEGTLDKYDGDAIKAFFGAPVHFKDHAKRACWVAIEMQEKMATLQEKWAKEKKPELSMRIGINTGVMVVGNMGSKNRMNYGMNGDSVNLAARLEGANKEYGTFTLISKSTYEQARDFIEAREIDFVRVIGRSKPTKIYELLGKKGCTDESTRKALPLYSEGLNFYKESKWQEAITCFEKALEKYPQDGPSLTLLQRCQLLQQDSNMEKDWDGIYSISSK